MTRSTAIILFSAALCLGSGAASAAPWLAGSSQVWQGLKAYGGDGQALMHSHAAAARFGDSMDKPQSFTRDGKQVQRFRWFSDGPSLRLRTGRTSGITLDISGASFRSEF